MDLLERIVGFTAEIEISASCARVYQALSLASPLNRYRVRGMTLSPLRPGERRYELINSDLPDIKFFMEEIEADAPTFYRIKTTFPEDQPVGILKGDETSYRLRDNGKDHCRLQAAGLFFTVPLYEEEVEMDAEMLRASVHDDLVRIKALIEEGVVAANSAGTLDDLREILEL